MNQQDECKKLIEQYGLSNCIYIQRDHALFIVTSIMDSLKLKDNLKDNMDNPKIFSLYLKFNDLTLQYVSSNEYHKFNIYTGNYVLMYSKFSNQPIKNYLVEIINAHHLPINHVYLTNVLQPKLYLIKYCLLPDIYAYILSMIQNIYLDDPDIIMELLFNQDIIYGYKLL